LYYIRQPLPLEQTSNKLLLPDRTKKVIKFFENDNRISNDRNNKEIFEITRDKFDKNDDFKSQPLQIEMISNQNDCLNELDDSKEENKNDQISKNLR